MLTSSRRSTLSQVLAVGRERTVGHDGHTEATLRAIPSVPSMLARKCPQEVTIYKDNRAMVQ